MNKELFVSSTPHETKVGLVEDDLLAEIYLERENEYTLAGSIYKGRVTRVLPGMQSAFVDLGLERDAFLYVSDFMELEEHDEDLTDVVPANRGVQDMRSPARLQVPAEGEAAGVETAESDSGHEGGSDEHFEAQDQPQGNEQPASTNFAGDSSSPHLENRERGGFRGRRRRRGGRRDGRTEGRGEARTEAAREDGRSDGRNEVRSEGRSDGRIPGRNDGRGEGRDRASEPRFSRPSSDSAPAARSHDSGRSQQFGPPAGYQPIVLPGESISKYSETACPSI